MLRRALILVALALAMLSTGAVAQEGPKPGGFGFAIEVDGEGFFLNPTLKAITIKSVFVGRPAANAGIKPGDQVIEVEGKQVVGTKGREFELLMKKNVGETLSLRLRKPNGEVYSVSLVAVAKQN